MRHHQQVANFKPVKRGANLQNFAYGRMHPIGSRQAQGGRIADTYTEYPDLHARNIEEIQTLFGYAYVSDIKTAN